MRVEKRSGQFEEVSFDKVIRRLKALCDEEPKLNNIDVIDIAKSVINEIFDGVKTSELDELAAEKCASMVTVHPDFHQLASRIIISNNQKNTSPSFSEVVTIAYNHKDHMGDPAPLVSKELYNVVMKHKRKLNDIIDYRRDFGFDYFAYKTLERAYLLSINRQPISRIQHMFLRVALGIWPDNMKKALKSYNLMSQRYFTHATPTLFNAGTPRPQLLSCFLLGMGDSISGIYKCLSDCAHISKWAGGIGIHASSIRAAGSKIYGTNGVSNGLTPMLKVFNETARYVDQCVTPETIIYTTEGPMEIQYCEAGKTQIFTTNGIEVIENVLEHSYEGEIYKINSLHSYTPLIITPEHPVYCLSGQRKGLNFSIIRKRLDKNVATHEWIDAKDLTCNDMLIFKIPDYEKDSPQITEDDCYMYGLLLGNGSMVNSSTTCYISLNSNTQKHVIEFVKTYLEQKCIKYFVNIQKEYNTRIRWNKNTILPFRYNMLYKINKEKYINERWVNLPLEKAKFIVKGLLHSDGSIGKELVFDSTSKYLIDGMRYICLRMGIPTGGYVRDRIGEKHTSKYGDVIENKKIRYCVRIPKTKELCELLSIEHGTFSKFFRHNGYIYSRISDITKEDYSGTLYDLQMDKTHNYMLSSGIVHNGGGKRKGSFAIYLEPWHADVEEFLDLKKNHGDENMRARDLFYAMWIPDLFMKRVKTGELWSLFCPNECRGLADLYGEEFETLYMKYEKEGKARKQISAQKLFISMAESQINTGTPYMLYKDNVNKKSNQNNLGTIKSSNLCVAPETLILTDKGHIRIDTLKDQKVNVWNGKEFSETTVRQTGQNQELIRVNFSDETSIDCTKYHKFYIQTKNVYYNTLKQDILKSSAVEIVEAQNLREGMKIVKCEYPIIDGKSELQYAYTHGFFCGDGTYGNKSNIRERRCEFKSIKDKAYCKRHIDYQKNNEISDYCRGMSYSKKPILSLYGDKTKLIEHLNYRSKGKITKQGEQDKITLSLPVDLKDKFFVPINYSLKSKLDWFAGYCDADGCIVHNKTNQSLQISSIHKDFLKNIKLMLQTCGIKSNITLMRKATKAYLPDSNRNNKLYDVKTIWRIFISSISLQKLREIGFSPKRLKINEHIPNRNAERFVKIKEVEYINRYDNTYCFNEKLRHVGIFNGMITSQCTEIMEYSSSEEYACCTLASGCPARCVVNKDFSDVKEVLVYTKDNCDYCKLVKMLCKQHNLSLKEVNLTNNKEQFEKVKTQLKEKYGAEFKTYPQVLILNAGNDHGETDRLYTYIGGYTEFEEYTRPYFDFNKWVEVCTVMTDNLNRVIDINLYPVPETKLSNERHRPLGLGLQGLADTYALMRYPFDSPQAYQLNKDIFATMYYAAMTKSMELAKEEGPYSTFKGSPLSEGKFQFDLWDNAMPLSEVGNDTFGTKITLDWSTLRKNVMEYGARNSLLIAPMPTASTSNIMGNNECFEPFSNNVYVRRVLAGEFMMTNKYMFEDLINLNQWSPELKDTIIYHKGSIQNIESIPKVIRNLYKTNWDIPQKVVLEQARDRGIYVCQSQSMNLYKEKPTVQQLTSMHYAAWKMGLKTGMYYLRTKGGSKKKGRQQFTIDPKLKEKLEKEDQKRENMKQSKSNREDPTKSKSDIARITEFEDDRDEACENCSA